MNSNNYKHLFEELKEKEREERKAVYEKYKIARKKVGERAFSETGLEELGFGFVCACEDGTIVVFKINEYLRGEATLEDYESVLEDIEVEPFESKYTESNAVVNGVRNGYPIQSYLTIKEGGEDNEA